MAFDRGRVAAMLRRHLYLQKRASHRWFDVVVWPMVDTVIWGSIGVFVDQQGGAGRSGTAYMLSAIVLMHVVYQSSIAVSTGFLDETWSRNLLNLMVTPLREGEYLASLALFGFAKLLVGTGVVALTAATLYAFNVTEAGWGLVPIAAVLMVTGWCVALFVIGLVLRFGPGAEILAWGLFFVVIALSGVFYPLDALPSALEPIAAALPSTHAFEAARALLDGRPLPWDDVGLAVAGVAVLSPTALAFVLHMLRTFRRRGYVTRYS